MSKIDILERLNNCVLISPLTIKEAHDEIKTLRAALSARELGADRLLIECRDEIHRLRQLVASLQDDGA